MPEKRLKSIIDEYNIKTIVDLRKPEDIKAIEKERAFVGTLGVSHVNIPSDQSPKDETVQEFLRIMDDDKRYPVLIHCEHGEGRAVLFSAIYRIEYENWDNEKARCASRVITYGTGFSLTSSKGKFLHDYIPHRKDISPAFPGKIHTNKQPERIHKT